MSYLFILGRILYGGYFVLSGWNHFSKTEMLTSYAGSKGVPIPNTAVLFSGLLIFLGGLSVLTGIMAPLGLWLIIVFLIPVSFKMHDFWKDTDPMQKMSNQVNFMK